MNRTSAPNSASGLYVDDNPATSTQGTLLIATDLNQRQEEIVNTIELSGITPSSGDDTQLGQAVRKLAGNGDYCDETSVDLSSASTSVDLTSFFAQSDGWVESWVWSDGDGTYQLDWDDATYSGKTIGGITANTLTADLKGEGQGRLTLRKQGNDAKILFFADTDGGNFGTQEWEKTTTGNIEFWDSETYTVAISTPSGNIQVTSTNLTPPTFAISPAVMKVRTCQLVDDGTARFVSWVVTGDAPTIGLTVGWEKVRLDDSISSTTGDRIVDFYAKGRWTTAYPVVG